MSPLDPHQEYEVTVQSVWWDGSMSPEPQSIRVKLSSLLPREIFLDSLRPKKMTSGWGRVRLNRAVSGSELRVAGRSFERGLGTNASSEIIYSVYSLYRWLEGEVGVDAASLRKRGTVEFLVKGDDRILWRSGIMKAGDPAKRIRVNISQVKQPSLEVTEAGDGNEGDHADWGSIRIVR